MSNQALTFIADKTLIDFLAESNRIESITRSVTVDEIKAAESFLDLEILTVEDVCNLVNVFEPGAKLRDKPGMDVKVGDHVPMRGSSEVDEHLRLILQRAVTTGGIFSHPFHTHQAYETLHPFMDGNGRSGRMIWLWQMKQQGKLDYALKLGFLHAWYYQSLSEGR